MDFSKIESCTAFAGQRQLARGPLPDVARAVRCHLDEAADAVLVFDDTSGRVIDLDLRGSADEVVARLPRPATQPAQEPPPRRGRGRPKLGVVSKEVTLLPRHWAWLAEQPRGASATLRQLVEKARREAERPDRIRRSRDAAYRFMGAIGGDLPGFEEACRALFAGDGAGFAAQTSGWPADVAAHARMLAGEALAG